MEKSTKDGVRRLTVATAIATLGLTGCGAVNGNDGEDRVDVPAPGNFRAIVTVTVDHPDGDPVSYVIACDGIAADLQGAADIDARAACGALESADVQARLIEGPPPDRMCTEIYGGPDTAKGHGNINGRQFEFAVDRTDGCGIAEWDQLLADILVEPRSMTR